MTKITDEIIAQAKAVTTREEHDAVNARFHEEVLADQTPAPDYFDAANALVDAHARTVDQSACTDDCECYCASCTIFGAHIGEGHDDPKGSKYAGRGAERDLGGDVRGAI